VGLVGRSGAGKTQFLEGLVPVLASRGYRVAVLKHTHQRDLETDQPGSDSYRFWAAGAAHVVLAAPDRIVHTHRCEVDPSLSQVLRGVHGVDLVLVEGYKSSSIPKLEVVRAGLDTQPLSSITQRLAFITDVPDLQDGVPCFALEDLKGVARFLIDEFLS
jgi:molybdopterin-guanine dinucleotide biosynthesis protein B